SQLGDDVMKVAALLKKLGIKKYDKVAILSSNMPNWGVAFYAIGWIGATAVPILPDFHPNEIQSILEHSESKLLFVSESLYKNLNSATLQLLDEIILLETFSLMIEKHPEKFVVEKE